MPAAYSMPLPATSEFAATRTVESPRSRASVSNAAGSATTAAVPGLHVVGGLVLRRESGRVKNVVSRRLQESAKAGGQVRVYQEFHARTRCWLFNWSDRLANSRHASRSSRSRSGNSRNTSSTESPAARYSRMDSTGYRNPRMTGLPWQISGLMAMRDNSEFIRWKASPRGSHRQAPFIAQPLRALRNTTVRIINQQPVITAATRTVKGTVKDRSFQRRRGVP